MTIKKTKTGWQVDIQPGGRGFKRYRKSFKTQGEAKRFESKVRAIVDGGETYTPPKKDRRKLSHFIEFWFQVHGGSLKDGQARRKKLHYLCDLLGDPILLTLKPSDIAHFRQQRLETGKTPNTVNHDIGYLRAVVNVAIRMDEWKGDNPFSAVKALRLPENELTYLSNEQIQRLFEALKISRSRDVSLIVWLCLKTGARWSEAQTLRSEMVRNQSVTFANTKNGRSRTVAISDDLYHALKAHGPSVGRIFRHDAYEAFTNALSRAGITLPRGQRTHVLRHTFASHFVMNGGDLLTLQKILGHRTLQMTMRYAHLSPGHLKEAVKFGPRISVDTSLTL
nr:Tyrosine recombinase XerC [Virgibacillus halodenitrificans]